MTASLEERNLSLCAEQLAGLGEREKYSLSKIEESQVQKACSIPPVTGWVPRRFVVPLLERDY